MDFPTVRHIRDLGIRPVKKRGQNFLVDKNIASKAVSQAYITPEDTVEFKGERVKVLDTALVQGYIDINDAETRCPAISGKISCRAMT